MKRAFWFDGAYMDQQIAETDITGARAVHFARNYRNGSVTENGAVGYRTTTKPLLDLNFQVSSLRAREEAYIVQEFVKAFQESPRYAVKWLFFVRDILQGLGERRTFRVCLKYLAVSQPKIARAVLAYVPEYGRYDDMLVLLDTPLAGDVVALYKKQLDRDLAAMEAESRFRFWANGFQAIIHLPKKQESMRESFADILRCLRRNTEKCWQSCGHMRMW